MVRAGSLLLPLLAVAQVLGCWRGAIANIDASLPRAELTAFDQEFFRTPAQMGVEHIQVGLLRACVCVCVQLRAICNI